MRYYPSLTDRDIGNQLIEISLQVEEYIGKFRLALDSGKGCRGNAALEFDIERFDTADIIRWIKTSCQIHVHPSDPNILLVTLTHPVTNETKTFVVDNEQFQDMIVGKSIIEHTYFPLTEPLRE